MYSSLYQGLCLMKISCETLSIFPFLYFMYVTQNQKLAFGICNSFVDICDNFYFLQLCFKAFFDWTNSNFSLIECPHFTVNHTHYHSLMINIYSSLKPNMQIWQILTHFAIELSLSTNSKIDRSVCMYRGSVRGEKNSLAFLKFVNIYALICVYQFILHYLLLLNAVIFGVSWRACVDKFPWSIPRTECFITNISNLWLFKINLADILWENGKYPS